MDYNQDKVNKQFQELGLKPEDVISKVGLTPALTYRFHMCGLCTPRQIVSKGSQTSPDARFSVPLEGERNCAVMDLCLQQWTAVGLCLCLAGSLLCGLVATGLTLFCSLEVL